MSPNGGSKYLEHFCSGSTGATGCNKKRKKWCGEQQRLFRFKSFGSHGYPAEFDRTFWKNVKALLEFGNFKDNLVCNGDGIVLSCWSFQLELHRHRPDRTVFLFVVEEPVEASSIYQHCKHCQYIGWGHHMVYNVKYHFVVPSKETAAAATTCLSCHGSYCDGGTALAAAIGKIKSSNLVEMEGHALHGIFHCNGFGHLLCVNGVEMGSELNGHHLMDLWDRLCTGLRARKVSLTDISQKKGMDLRLLHGVAYAGSWFRRWGYQFGRGSFGVTEPMYQKAIQAIQNIPLCLLHHHLGSSDHYIPLIFTKYQALSDHSLITLADLFQFMLELKSRLPKEPSIDSFNPGILLETSCRWSPKRIEMASRVIVDALKRADFRWVSRQEVRDAARAYIGDTGLLDFVLKSLGNHVVGNYLVRRSLNPVTKVLEYCLEDISNTLPNHDSLMDPKTKASPCKITRFQLAKDIFYLYKCILREKKVGLNSCGILTAVPVATRIILDSKYLVKEFSQELPSRAIQTGETIEIYCTVQIKDKEKKSIPMPMLPYECLIIRGSMTINELKREVEKCFREMYWGLRSLVIESIANTTTWENDRVYGQIDEGSELVFEGGIDANELQGMWESSSLNGRGCVDCACGAKEDDGERMVPCDICEVWQHTRCLRIPNSEEIPRIFLCSRCEQDIIFSPSLM
ncbi:hypothetical protein Ancab_000402 [Ancistrocladus abbreviatus]